MWPPTPTHPVKTTVNDQFTTSSLSIVSTFLWIEFWHVDHVCASYIVAGVRAVEGAHHSSETITVLASVPVGEREHLPAESHEGFVVDESSVGSTYRFGCSEEASGVCVVNATECD